MRFILASQSPRRRELLASIGLTFDVMPSDVPEVRQAGESPEEYVARLSRDKAAVIAAKHGDAWIIAADTTVLLGDELLEKPVDTPYGPYADGFSEQQHKYGPFAPIRAAIARLKAEKDTKAERPRRVPVTPQLAAILADWKLRGWPAMFGRKPEPDDLILPCAARVTLGSPVTQRRAHVQQLRPP